MVFGLLRTAHSWFSPAWDAIFARKLPWTYRWRLLALQPITFLSYAIGSYRYIFSRPYTTEWLPIAPGRSLRVLVFKSPSPTGDESRLRPLHLNCHAGAFIGGLPEMDAPFCARLARETGAVVVSATYRHAPRYPFPAAIDDVDALVAYLQRHARERYGADPDLMTVSGGSAGGNLVLAAALSVPGRVKAAVTFYGVMDLRLKPLEKPRPDSIRRGRDPLWFLMPLYDSYAAPARARNMDNPRMSPIVAKIDDLPENMLMVIPGIDILVHEQMTFIERLKEEAASDPRHSGRRFEVLYDEKTFHGYLELPPIVLREKRERDFSAAILFIRDAHRKYDWYWQLNGDE